VLKLVYQTAVFGPINLEYEKPVVRVGSSQDNDLVLPHPSVRPHHCLLSFWEERLALLPAEADAQTAQAAWAQPSGHIYESGEELRIGELSFMLGHSANTVAVPEAVLHPSLQPTGAEEDGAVMTGPRYYCSHCGRYVPVADLKRIGLVGRAKHLLCPQCSSPVVKREHKEAATGFRIWLQRLWKRVKRWLASPAPRRPAAGRAGKRRGGW
jgi:hypothetical protein